MSVRIVHTKDTRSKMEFTFRNKESSDSVFCLIKNQVNIYNNMEFYQQLKVYKNAGFVSRYSNIRKITINNEECYLFIIQEKEDSDEYNPCTLSIAYGLMVDGVGYITTDKNLLSVVQRSIGIDTKNGKGKEFCE
jgi:hypothetical protein